MSHALSLCFLFLFESLRKRWSSKYGRFERKGTFYGVRTFTHFCTSILVFLPKRSGIFFCFGWLDSKVGIIDGLNEARTVLRLEIGHVYLYHESYIGFMQQWLMIVATEALLSLHESGFSSQDTRNGNVRGALPGAQHFTGASTS